MKKRMYSIVEVTIYSDYSSFCEVKYQKLFSWDEAMRALCKILEVLCTRENTSLKVEISPKVELARIRYTQNDDRFLLQICPVTVNNEEL